MSGLSVGHIRQRSSYARSPFIRYTSWSHARPSRVVSYREGWQRDVDEDVDEAAVQSTPAEVFAGSTAEREGRDPRMAGRTECPDLAERTTPSMHLFRAIRSPVAAVESARGR